ncbi:16S rRNA (cytidine(1402)-2'-O)-methyltransferase [Pelagibacteraceae bacterium]|jgi:16S rRNA (cytidine1402-2'-O)-methyltransferase|nr:16S rRNA (cytidine(1402)-2'-O)-methyltransferase [Pelagibacteraceae bacterium]
MNIKQQTLKSALYLIPTPIGNLEDISTRSIYILEQSDYILCEDTRVTLKFLNHLKLKKKLIAFHQFNENEKIKSILQDLKQNKILSLVSDAGTPALSDPGRLLISKCHEQNIGVIPIPGASAITCAISASGFSDQFFFCGFLPKKDKEINNMLESYKSLKASLVFFMPARDLEKNLIYFNNFFSQNNFFLAREMTKIHETYIRDKVSNLKNYTKDNLKGEITFIIDNNLASPKKIVDIDEEIKMLIGKMSSKDIAEYLSKKLAINKKSIYQKAIKINE